MQKKAKMNKNRREKQEKDKKKQQVKRDKDFIPPVEEPSKKIANVSDDINIKSLKSKIKEC